MAARSLKCWVLTPALLVMATLAGCTAPGPAVAAGAPSQAAEVGQHVRLTGRLALKGSMPMPQAVLTLDTGARWELKGIAPLTATRLQNKRVAVEGKVVRNQLTPMLLPSLAVTGIALKQ